MESAVGNEKALADAVTRTAWALAVLHVHSKCCSPHHPPTPSVFLFEFSRHFCSYLPHVTLDHRLEVHLLLPLHPYLPGCARMGRKSL